MEEYSFHINGKRFDIIMNASGCRSRSKEHFDNLIQNGLNTIITKSCTLYKNDGNDEPNFKEINEHISINCLGMPNYGYKYYRNLFPGYYKQGITYVISMDASNWEDLKTMLIDYDEFIGNMKTEWQTKYNIQDNIQDSIKEFVEINVSCPNKLDVNMNNSKISRIIAYDPILLSRLLENIKQLDLVNLNIGIKLSPYVDNVLLEQISKVLIKYSNIVKYIVCGNSIPNGMIINLENGKPLLSIKTGGISGTANRLLGVSNVYQFNNIFKSANNITSIAIFGCGGVETDTDVLEYLNAGAQSVQIGRILYVEGVERIVVISNKLMAKL
jgi:dihydroorotate dehydrogenase (fumarate)